MKQQLPSASVEGIEDYIYTVRGHRVMLDADLARIYGVTTKLLNRAVKRNAQRFPSDFVFQLTAAEIEELQSRCATTSSERGTMRCQFGTASKRNVRFLPYAFTEHGAIMAANVLNSPRAIQMSVFVVRAFVKMRGVLTDTREQARKLSALEKELKERLDVHEAAIVTILQRVMDIIDPPPRAEPPPKKIGFQVREPRAVYRVRGNER
jgi:hypothetical protein